MARLFYRVDRFEMNAATRIIGESELWRAQNMCGHTILHRALLTNDESYALRVMELFPKLATIADNVSESLHLKL